MIYYKSYRIIDGKPRWVVTDEDGNINKNPTKEQLKMAVIKKRIVMKNRVCCKCGSRETYIDPYGKERWHNHACDKENCTKSLCHTCGGEHYRRSVGIPKMGTVRIDHSNTMCCICGRKDTYIKSDGRPLWLRYRGDDNKSKWDGKSYTCTVCNSEIRNNMEDSYSNLIKAMSQSRNDKLSKYSETGEGIIVEAVVAKIRRIKMSVLELDSFHTKIDLFYDQEYGEIQVKGPTFDGRRWDAIFGIEHYFDTLIVVCMSKDRKNVERVYIIPESELYGEKRINIYEDFSKLSIGSRYEWVERFRIDEKLKDIYDVCYKDLINCLKDKEFFGIKDIEIWLKGGI